MMKALSTSILQLLIPHHIYSYADISALECVGPCIAYDIRNATMIIQLNIKKTADVIALWSFYVLFENGHFLRFAVTWLKFVGFAFSLCPVVYFATDMWKCFWTSIFPATSTSGSTRTSRTSLFFHLFMSTTGLKIHETPAGLLFKLYCVFLYLFRCCKQWLFSWTFKKTADVIALWKTVVVFREFKETCKVCLLFGQL